MPPSAQDDLRRLFRRLRDQRGQRPADELLARAEMLAAQIASNPEAVGISLRRGEAKRLVEDELRQTRAWLDDETPVPADRRYEVERPVHPAEAEPAAAQSALPGFSRVTVFAGSHDGAGEGHVAAAEALGALLAENGYQLLYGGEAHGLMAAVARGYKSRGATPTGIVTPAMVIGARVEPGIEAIAVDGQAERRRLLVTLAHAYVVLPGGLGTLAELFEAWGLVAVGWHAGPLGVLDADGTLAPLFDAVRALQQAGFVSKEAAALPICEADPAALLRRLRASVEHRNKGRGRSKARRPLDPGDP